MSGTPNPNWPLIEDSWGPYWGAGQGILPGNRVCEITSRVRGTTVVNRGKQNELDQVRAGEYRLRIENLDAAFDPTNTSSPFNGRVVPFQPVRKRAQYPRTVNLLNQTQATGGDVGGWPLGALGGNNTVQVFSETDSTGGAIVASGTAFRGANVLQFAVPNATAAGLRPFYTSEPAAEPGTTYTVQIRVRNITPATTLQVKPHFGWYLTPAGASTFTYGSTVTLTGSATAAWTQLTLTATAPANALGLNVGIAVAAVAGAACTVQADEWQLEKAAAATAWVQPGVWYPIYQGFAERWPQTWDDPRYVTTDPVAADTFSLLSQIQLRDPLNQELFARSPRFIYALADPQGSDTFADSTGQCPPARTAVSLYGAGSLTAGTQIAAATPAGLYTGSTGTVVSIANGSPGTALPDVATFISLSAAGINGPTDPTRWSRVIAFRYTGPAITANAVMWSAMDGQRGAGGPSGSRINIGLNSSGYLYCTMVGPTGAGATYPGPTVNAADGQWHLAVVSVDVSLSTIQIVLDDAQDYWAISAPNAPAGIIGDFVGGFVDVTVGNGTTNNWQGDISLVCEVPTFLYFTTDIPAIYAAWRSSCAGDSTAARYQRILGWAGYAGGTSIQTGLTTAMGPAAGGTDALSALQEAVTTEGGTHYVDRNGQLTFRSRSDRYNKITSTYTFGDGPGEYPYEPGVTADYDSTRLANIVQATQPITGQVFTAKDATSIAAYYPRTMTRSINTQNALEVQDAAYYLLSRYRQPALRINSITLNPGANPTLWPVCLSLELGTRVTVNRRTAAGTTISLPCFVENIQIELGPSDTARWTLQLSPADLQPYGIFASFHTQLNAATLSGVTSIVIKNGADNTNPAAAQLAYGQQLVLGLGTANQETVAIKAISTTTAGWTTATITLQAATTKAHAANDVVCEPLPAGITDPATWDATSKFDATVFAY